MSCLLKQVTVNFTAIDLEVIYRNKINCMNFLQVLYGGGFKLVMREPISVR
jgi:hypothetical protein